MNVTDQVPVLNPEDDTTKQLRLLDNAKLAHDFSIHFEDLPPGKIRNAYRAQKMAATLLTYAEDMHAPNEPLYNSIGDLLSDLMHMCDLFPKVTDELGDTYTFDDILSGARSRYEEEVAGE